MDEDRRKLLAWMAAAGLLPTWAQAQTAAWNAKAFEPKQVSETLKALGGLAPTRSADIQLDVPDVAENGASVPVTVEARLPAVSQIAVMVEGNPHALTSISTLAESALPFFFVRVKMAQSARVHALVKSDGRWFTTSKEVKVTIGGCDSA